LGGHRCRGCGQRWCSAWRARSGRWNAAGDQGRQRRRIHRPQQPGALSGCFQSNLFTLDLDTHKFEAHYTASLVGQLPEAAGRYHAWSPSFHAANIRDPLYIFQGSIDKVVPPSQSEEIIAALQKTGVTHQYKLYQGEGHGFRKSENIVDYLKETERFLMMHVLFAA
jgi:acetyl esterase/lipase